MKRWCMAAALCLATWSALAQTPELDASVNETVFMLPKKQFFSTSLETTLFKPDGDGPFPVVVINHGKSFGKTQFQERYRPLVAVRYFLQRGYVVVAPMRRGFSRSEGSYIGGGCNIEGNGEAQADDVQTTLDWVVAQPWADKTRMVVAGQSHGGWTTLAFGARNYPGVRGLINFAGGLRINECVGWQNALVKGAASYAKASQVPSLWFYGDNDNYFSPPTWQAMFGAYTAAGGKATLVAFGSFGKDAHTLFDSRTGSRIWQPEVSKFLASVGMPDEPVPAFEKYAGVTPMPIPPKTDFAALGDEGKIPYIRVTGRAAYKKYLVEPLPRAFAIASNGAWAWAGDGDDPLKRALDACAKTAKIACKLYSVDEDVVWKVD